MNLSVFVGGVITVLVLLLPGCEGEFTNYFIGFDGEEFSYSDMTDRFSQNLTIQNNDTYLLDLNMSPILFNKAINIYSIVVVAFIESNNESHFNLLMETFLINPDVNKTFSNISVNNYHTINQTVIHIRTNEDMIAYIDSELVVKVRPENLTDPFNVTYGNTLGFSLQLMYSKFPGPNIDNVTATSINKTGTFQFEFTDSNTNSTNIQYEWDYNDDGKIDWTGKENLPTQFTYPLPGIYKALITVTDEFGYNVTNHIIINFKNHEDSNNDSPGLFFIPNIFILLILALIKKKKEKGGG